MLQRLSGTLPVSELLNSLMYFSLDREPSEDGIVDVKLFESKYRYCKDDNVDNTEGMLPVSPQLDRIRLARPDT